MSHRGHKGRCFRAWRGTVRRKREQGQSWEYPIRWKVPMAIRPFLAAAQRNQVRAQHDQMGLAIARYAQHQAKVGGPKVRARGAMRGG